MKFYDKNNCRINLVILPLIYKLLNKLLGEEVNWEGRENTVYFR